MPVLLLCEEVIGHTDTVSAHLQGSWGFFFLECYLLPHACVSTHTHTHTCLPSLWTITIIIIQAWGGGSQARWAEGETATASCPLRGNVSERETP